MQMDDNRDLFWKLMEPEYMQAVMFCRKLTGNRERGDDLFQDAVMTAITKFSSLKDTASFRPWMYRIFINTFKSKTRRPWWKRKVPLTSEIQLRLTGDDPIETHTARRWLQRAFRTLSADEQVLVTLHELEGWPIYELALLRDKSEGAIKAKLFRARSKMKKALIAFSRKSQSQDDAASQSDEDDQCAVVKQGTD